MECDILTVPGLWDSGPEHWQSLWERRYPEWRRVTHRDWVSPVRAEWVAELDAAIALSEGPPILVAHSLGCATIAHWAASNSRLRISGAMLVAPADVDAPGFPPEAQGFGPMPMARLPFPTLVVASSDDPYAGIERARAFADAWGGRLVDIGAAGHISAAEGFGEWPEGRQLLADFCAYLEQ